MQRLIQWFCETCECVFIPPCLQVYIGEQNACNNQMWKLLDGTASRAFPLAGDATTGAYRIGDEALTDVQS